MTVYIKTTNSVVAGFGQTLVANDMLIISQACVFGSNNTFGVFVNGAGVSVQVNGTLVGAGAAISSNSATTITIGVSGQVLSTNTFAALMLGQGSSLTNAGIVTASKGYAVRLLDTLATVTNTGTIFGERGGVLMSGQSNLTNLGTIKVGQAMGAAADEGAAIHVKGDFNNIINKGTIESNGFGLSAGIYLSAAGGLQTAAHTDIINEGIIRSGSGFGIEVGDTNSGLNLLNTGLISGFSGGIWGALGEDVVRSSGTITGIAGLAGGLGINLRDGNDLLVNSGLIVGYVEMGSGNDRYDGRLGQVDSGAGLAGVVQGAEGNDILAGGRYEDHLSGGNGNNTLYGGDGDDDLSALAGNDTLYGGNGNDTLSSGDGANRLWGGWGEDSLYGGNSTDNLDGGAGDDVMQGFGGNDGYVLSSEGDTVIEAAGGGSDTVVSSVISLNLAHFANVEGARALGSAGLALTGTYASNALYGNDGANRIDGRGGNDTIQGGAGADTIFGSSGNDVIAAGTGPDSISGGSGTDVFVFAASTEINEDTITDFAPGLDRIDLHLFMAGGAYIGAASFSAALQVRYDAATGVLAGDVDGNGVFDWAMTLSTKPATLVPNDFQF